MKTALELMDSKKFNAAMTEAATLWLSEEEDAVKASALDEFLGLAWRQAHGEMSLRGGDKAGTAVLQSLPRDIHEGMEEDAPAKRRAKAKNERQELRGDLPPQGPSEAKFLRGVRRRKRRRSSFELSEAAGSQLAMQNSPSGTPQKSKRGRKPKKNPVDPGTPEPLTPDEIKSYAALADKMTAATPRQEKVLADAISSQVIPLYNKGYRSFAINPTANGRPIPMNREKWLAALKLAGMHCSDLDWTYDERTWRGLALSPGQIPLTLV